MVSVENFSRENNPPALPLAFSSPQTYAHTFTHTRSLLPARKCIYRGAFGPLRTVSVELSRLSVRSFRFPCSCIVAFEPRVSEQPTVAVAEQQSVFLRACTVRTSSQVGCFDCAKFRDSVCFYSRVYCAFRGGKRGPFFGPPSIVGFAQFAIPVFVSYGFRTVF